MLPVTRILKLLLLGAGLLALFLFLAVVWAKLGSYGKRLEEVKQAHGQMRDYLKMARNDKKIDAVLAGLVQETPGAAMARVVTVGAASPAGSISLPRIENAYFHLAPGHTVASGFGGGYPLAQWSQQLPEYFAGHCAWVADTDKLVEPQYKARLEKDGIRAFLSCPLTDKAGTFFGIVGVTWDDVATVPPDDQIGETRARVQGAARQIANLLLAND